MGVMEGILLGVVYSLVMLLRAIAFPPDAVLGRGPDGGWHDPAYRREAAGVPGLLVYRFSAPLFFANSNLFRERVEARIAAAAQPVQAVVIDCGAIHDVDLMACEMLDELYGELTARGIRLAFADLRDRVKRDIERGLSLPSDQDGVTFSSVAAAAQALSVP
jgi:MFS superfamily sulfate permease-like transporter